MSKIGRRPIMLSSAKVSVKGTVVLIEGPKARFEHELPSSLEVRVEGSELKINPIQKAPRNVNADWGLHRALLANKVKGSETGFERKVSIVGLGYKAVQQGPNVVFTLGYTHKIEMELPRGVEIVIDKSGQNLLVKSSDKLLLGDVCDKMRSFRMPEPYKGTGIVREGDVIIKKAGKAKSA